MRRSAEDSWVPDMSRVICKPKSIDAYGVRVDGSLDLIIVANGPLDTRAETRRLLLEKLENYLSVYRSAEAATVLGFSPRKALRIVLVLPVPAGSETEALLREAGDFIRQSGKDNVFDVQLFSD